MAALRTRLARQFRLLLLYKEVQLNRLSPAEAARELSVHHFVLSKIAAQSRNFELDQLERIYAEMGEMDGRIKNGLVDVEIALDAFVAGVTSR